MKAGEVTEHLSVVRDIRPLAALGKGSARSARVVPLAVTLFAALSISTFGSVAGSTAFASVPPILYPGTNAWPSEAASRSPPAYQLTNASPEEVSQLLQKSFGPASPLELATSNAVPVNPQNQLVGIGVAVSKIAGEPLVVRQVLPGTPAAKAGIKEGFMILSADGTNTAEISLAECVDCLRGALGTTVTLVVVDTAIQKTNTLAIKREAITIPIRPSEPAAVDLTGKPLPDLALSGVASADYPTGRPLLVILIDAEQRPSRRALALLVEQNASLKQRGVAVVVLQAAAMDTNAFGAWKKAAALPYPVGRFSGDADKTRAVWGAVALPWIILTDKTHRVSAQGLQPEEVASKVDALLKNNPDGVNKGAQSPP